MKKSELLSKEKEWVDYRQSLKSPVYFIEMGWAGQGWLCYQKVVLVDKDENEAVAYFDTGTPIEEDEEVSFRSFKAMCTARYSRDHGKNLHNKVMLRPEIYQQLERRLCLDPYQEASEEENTTHIDRS
jgi:hypothetical protein